uniref:Uncharacterized protein n=1 Tax=Candidatus Kentrum sp. FM TaxID=2126340 RepID=A0A450WCV2_9GAMM|nr:MAG: hypothetical protein BECKFM1743C_GA0114222_102325 [Candidatus Kentron sp. FM]VFJ59561.1 MAG: hypothetical protein BECKFM1743A_GA0114220_102405 [Candidatus Kentron sp. FM]VFK14818.1 MAG: hypothetical protein BECKFM1743B_GA0114221_103413 [Candidatus Kentron sp. FM]
MTGIVFDTLKFVKTPQAGGFSQPLKNCATLPTHKNA